MSRYLLTGFLLMLGIFVAACAQESFDRRPESPDDSSLVTWEQRGGDAGFTRYSALDQINRSNVDELEVAWIYHSGDQRGDKRGTIECNPIVVGEVLYCTTPALKVFAINADTGKELWTFDPYRNEGEAQGVNRGVTYWESEDGTDKRILFTAGWTSRLFAIDAETGQPIESFGENGVVDIGRGIQTEKFGPVTATSPGIIYENLYILGTRVGESARGAPGHVSAYDARTGERVWTFHTIPGPGEFGHDTWGGGWKDAGGANAWGGLTVDKERGMVFLPLGSPAYAFYGGDRSGKNLFSSAVVALNARTGKRIWHFQLVHHDLWDREPASPPNLVTVKHEGRTVDAVAQVSKRGDVFLLNRETGDPLFPVEKRPVPPSEIPDEEAWPTQPFPVKPKSYARQGYTKEDLPTRSEKARQYARKRLRETKNGRMFIPPSRAGTIMLPGFRGGSSWGGASFDPTTGYLYVSASEVPGILAMESTKQEDPDQASFGGQLYQTNCSSCHGPDRKGDPPAYPSLVDINERMTKLAVMNVINNGQGMMPAFKSISPEKKKAILNFLFGEEPDSDGMKAENIENTSGAAYPFMHTGWKTFRAPDGYPAIKPPWGTLTAIDMNKGKIVWQMPLGEYEELTKEGLPPTGTDNLGGSVVTEGGLVFIGASKDEKFRAFDKQTGEILWETSLPAGGYATPSTYKIDGKQYVVIAAGGGGLMRTESSDAFVAFALP